MFGEDSEDGDEDGQEEFVGKRKNLRNSRKNGEMQGEAGNLPVSAKGIPQELCKLGLSKGDMPSPLRIVTESCQNFAKC
jgi:hypothetical protein